MVDSFASGKTQAVEPSFGSYVDTWQLPVNANFGTFDAAVSGTTTIDVTGVVASNPYVNVTFSEFNATTNPTPWTQPNAGQNLRINLIGAVTFGITVLIQPIAGFWIFTNATIGASDITVRTSAGGGTAIVLPRGFNSIVYSDGTNVSFADTGGAIDAITRFVPSAVPVGAIMPFAGATVPNANWIACSGAAVSRTTYAALFAYIGTLYGTGDGSTTFNVPNLNQGAFIRGVGGNAADQGTLQQDNFASHTHTVNDPGHFHGPPPGNNGYLTEPNTNGGIYNGGSFGGALRTGTATTDITIAAAGGTETRPINFAMLYCIRAL